MFRNILLLLIILYISMIGITYGREIISARNSYGNTGVKNSTIAEVVQGEEGRRKKYAYYHLWFWHALSIAFWIKVKLFVVAFVVGSTLLLGLRYSFPNRCKTDTPIIYEHPYALESVEHYGGKHYDTDSWSSNTNVVENAIKEPSSYPTNSYLLDRRQKRNFLKNSTNQNGASFKEMIGETVLTFMGLKTTACRKRFLCELEFELSNNSLTLEVFRYFNNNFFTNYTTKSMQANESVGSWENCAINNPECVELKL